MAIKIDNDLLQQLGLATLPESEKNSLLRHIYETLEMRVGIRLADQMSNEQLDEFEKYFDAKDDAGAFKWLETNFPNYKEIVQQEFDKLKTEIAQSAQDILNASQQQAATQPQPVAAPQEQQQPQQPQSYAQAPQQPVQQQYQQPPAPAYQQPTAPVPPQQPQPYAPQPQQAPQFTQQQYQQPGQPQAYPQQQQQPPAGPISQPPQYPGQPPAQQ